MHCQWARHCRHTLLLLTGVGGGAVAAPWGMVQPSVALQWSP